MSTTISREIRDGLDFWLSAENPGATRAPIVAFVSSTRFESKQSLAAGLRYGNTLWFCSLQENDLYKTIRRSRFYRARRQAPVAI